VRFTTHRAFAYCELLTRHESLLHRSAREALE
jgi:hypothetical protein